MAATDEQITTIRSLLGERIPSGGAQSDTLFTDEEIEQFFQLGDENVNKAVYQGWLAKAAELSNLVDTAEGNYSRKFGQLLEHANSMIKYYGRISGGDPTARTRVGTIHRPRQRVTRIVSNTEDSGGFGL
jgi:hypothetical protein